jgi:stringent starvation protein B
MSPTQPLPPKKEVALALLERSSVYLHLDPRPTAVVVPVWYKKQPKLVLQVGLNMAVPIPDLRLDDDGVSCTLSFNRQAFFCVVPWASVFAMAGDDGSGMVWPNDVPVEIARQTQVRAVEKAPPQAPPADPEAKRGPKAQAPKAKRARKRPELAAVTEREAAAKPAKTVGATADRAARTTKAAASSRPPVAPAPVPRAADDLRGKKKRELPPYLRVVK